MCWNRELSSSEGHGWCLPNPHPDNLCSVLLQILGRRGQNETAKYEETLAEILTFLGQAFSRHHPTPPPAAQRF